MMMMMMMMMEEREREFKKGQGYGDGDTKCGEMWWTCMGRAWPYHVASLACDRGTDREMNE
jgi:hypothetical protein